MNTAPQTGLGHQLRSREARMEEIATACEALLFSLKLNSEDPAEKKFSVAIAGVCMAAKMEADAEFDRFNERGE